MFLTYLATNKVTVLELNERMLYSFVTRDNLQVLKEQRTILHSLEVLLPRLNINNKKP